MDDLVLRFLLTHWVSMQAPWGGIGEDSLMDIFTSQFVFVETRGFQCGVIQPVPASTVDHRKMPSYGRKD